jgi:hypothetical protein
MRSAGWAKSGPVAPQFVLPACFVNLAIAILDGAFRAAFCKPFVTAPNGKLEHG